MYKKLFFAVLLFGLIFGCAQKVPIKEELGKELFLKLNFEPQKSIKYKQETFVSQTVEMQGMTQTFEVSSEIIWTQTVEDTGETTLVKITLNDASGMVKAGGMTRKIDELYKLKDKDILIKIDSDNKVTEVEGIKDIEYFRKEKGAENQFKELFEFLPNKSIKIGESWEKEFNGTKCTYTLKGIEKKKNYECAKIEFEKLIEKDFEEGGAKGKVKGKEKGTIYFVITEGIIIEEKATASMEGEASISADMKIPIYMDQETSIKIIK